MKRVHRESFGTAYWIAPRVGGAITQCAFCPWGRFFSDAKRKRYSALARAASSLRAHVRNNHADRLTRFSTAEEIFG